jgi:hypothetical protein
MGLLDSPFAAFAPESGTKQRLELSLLHILACTSRLSEES